MCDLNKAFKLCTCDADALEDEDIGWFLQRRNKKKEVHVVVGSVVSVIESKEAISTKKNIEKQLNAKNCFDFEYLPQEDDRLQIRDGQSSFNYRFVAGQWIIDNSSTFDSWRRQLEQYNLGKIKQI